LLQSLFTPDGRGVLTCLRNDTVLVWDFPAFNLRSTLPLPANSPATSSTDKPRVYFRGFVASADGSLLAAGARYAAWDNGCDERMAGAAAANVLHMTGAA
jgi:hypothetical protein